MMARQCGEGSKGSARIRTDLASWLLPEESGHRPLALSRGRLGVGSRGVTLVEVMIVVVILGLIAGGVAIGVIPKFQEAQEKTTRQSAMALRQAAEMYRSTQGGDKCPTADELKKEKQIDSNSSTADAWGTPFKIVCEEDETYVVSLGRDKKEGSADDIRVPALASEKK